jgi:hypothetical protein
VYVGCKEFNTLANRDQQQLHGVNLPYVKRGYYLAKCDYSKLSIDNQTVANPRIADKTGYQHFTVI